MLKTINILFTWLWGESACPTGSPAVKRLHYEYRMELHAIFLVTASNSRWYIIFWTNSPLKQMMFHIFPHHQLQGNTTQQYYEAEKSCFKGIVMSWNFCHSLLTHVVLYLYDFIWIVLIEHSNLVCFQCMGKKACLLFNISTEEIKSYSSEFMNVCDTNDTIFMFEWSFQIKSSFPKAHKNNCSRIANFEKLILAYLNIYNLRNIKYYARKERSNYRICIIII